MRHKYCIFWPYRSLDSCVTCTWGGRKHEACHECQSPDVQHDHLPWQFHFAHAGLSETKYWEERAGEKVRKNREKGTNAAQINTFMHTFLLHSSFRSQIIKNPWEFLEGLHPWVRHFSWEVKERGSRRHEYKFSLLDRQTYCQMGAIFQHSSHLALPIGC